MQIIIINIWNRSSAKATPTIWVRVCVRALAYKSIRKIGSMREYIEYVVTIRTFIEFWMTYELDELIFVFVAVYFVIIVIVVFIFDCTCSHMTNVMAIWPVAEKKNYYQHSKMCSMNTSTLISHFIYRMRYEMQESNTHKNSLSILFYGFFGRLAIDQRNKSI